MPDIGNLLLRARSRAVWADPVRKLRTLEGFGKTEADGAADIDAAVKKVADPRLRAHFERHAADEARHAELFRRRAGELRAVAAAAPSSANDPDKLYDLSRERGRDEVNSHGFFSAGVFEERGEVAYVAMLHVAERRAASLFRVHRDLTRDDQETCAVFEEILRDEQYHVAYTGTELKRWRQQGRSKEVRTALSAARGSRFFGAWKRLGARAGESFGRLVLLVLYFTLLAPFGLLAKASRARRGYVKPGPAPPRAATRSQY